MTPYFLVSRLQDAGKPEVTAITDWTLGQFLPRCGGRSAAGFGIVTQLKGCELFGRVDIDKCRTRPVNVERMLAMMLHDRLAATFTG